MNRLNVSGRRITSECNKGVKKSNSYAKEYPDYTVAPKAVIAAVAYSLALRLCSDDFEEAENMIKEEWAALYNAGIVPQKPRVERVQ